MVRLVEVKAFYANSIRTYADVIRGIRSLVAHRAQYNIRVI